MIFFLFVVFALEYSMYIERWGGFEEESSLTHIQILETTTM